MDAKELVIKWLNDAHSMENSLVEVLERQAGQSEDYPQVRAKIEEHLQQTQRHQELVAGCVNRLGGSVSSVKTMMGDIMGKMQGMTTGAAEDTLVKNAIADFAAENFEIASYTALIQAAQQIGDMETVNVCQQILMDEENMRQWLEQNMPMAVTETMKSLTAVPA